MRIAIHQPNFIPWMPFFEKMDQCDVFVILRKVQFTKGGYQNRTQIGGKWLTNPVVKGFEPIAEKKDTSGKNIYCVNMLWILAIVETLGIKTKIEYDFETDKTGSERLVEICKHYGADEYLTNMDAFDKYLEKEPFDREGIKIVPFVASTKKHVFELFQERGIEGTRKMLKGRQNDSLQRMRKTERERGHQLASV